MAPHIDENMDDTQPDVVDDAQVPEDSGGEEVDDSTDPLQNQELIRLIRTAAGAELVVNDAAKRALSSGNWGNLLGAAPDALGRLGQCFVLSSDPLAASLVFPEGTGLRYQSLRGNLVHCSQLGRTAFREAEAKMKRVALVAEGVCEPDGIIDRILEAIDDDDLAELDLPEQLARLKSLSEECVTDTKLIKERVDAWGQFAMEIHNACVDKEENLEKTGNDISGQVDIKELEVKMKQAQVNESQKQTEEYRRQLSARQQDLGKAEKAQGRGYLTDLALSAGHAFIEGAKHYFSPWSVFSSISSAVRSDHGHSSHGSASKHVEDPLAQLDPGYVLAQQLQQVIHMLALCLTYEYGPSEEQGIDWDGLCGRAERERDIRYIRNLFNDVARKFPRKTSALTDQVLDAGESAHEVVLAIEHVVKSERNVGQDTNQALAVSVDPWRRDVKKAERQITNILTAGYEAVEREKAQKEKDRSRPLSREQQRYEMLKLAQDALEAAEQRLLKRLDDEMKATAEFSAMELELKRLLTEKTTMEQMKDIVGDCVKHLLYFCERLDELAVFFNNVHQFIEDMDKSRAAPFRQAATTVKAVSDRAKTEQDEATKLKRERLVKRRLEQLRIDALSLKGYYLVAQTMAHTYTEVSDKYIMPGVETIGRLGLPEAKKLTKDERAAKVSDVGDMARKAREDVKRLANSRKKQLITAMSDNRGEIDEIRAILN